MITVAGPDEPTVIGGNMHNTVEKRTPRPVKSPRVLLRAEKRAAERLETLARKRARALKYGA